MNTDGPEMKFEQMKCLCRKMIVLPIAAMIIATIIFILEGFPYPGRSGPTHSILSEQLATGLYLFDILYLFVLLLFVVTLFPVIKLLADRELRKIHPAMRLRVLYRFLVYAWITFFASRLMLGIYYGVLWLPEVLMRNFIFGGLLVAAYFYFKKRYTEKPETMFP